MNNKIFKKTPPRLHHVFQKYDPPLYFITFNTWHRAALLNNERVHRSLLAYAQRNARGGRAIGRYVIMPDHIHLFVRLRGDTKLSDFVRLLKQALDRELKLLYRSQKMFWQPGLFDHLLRDSESYMQKWRYVRENPVRAGLVKVAEEWPYQGKWF